MRLKLALIAILALLAVSAFAYDSDDAVLDAVMDMMLDVECECFFLQYNKFNSK